MDIEIKESTIIINNVSIKAPFILSDFENVLGQYEKECDSEYIWNQFGISILINENKTLYELRIKYAHDNEFSFISGKTCFKGNLIINSKNYIDFFNINNKDSILKSFDIKSFTGAACLSEDKKIVALMIDPEEVENKIIDPYKYKFKAIKNSIIEFHDFNFKLAVIQQLMYDTNLLQPKLELLEFIKLYKKREIDINEYYCKVIPEVKEYFKKLPIPIKLLKEIDEIYQDGGNEIYMNTANSWNGEDSLFNITSTNDLKLVPNLKKITLFYDDNEEMMDKFSKKGIDTEYL